MLKKIFLLILCFCLTTSLTAFAEDSVKASVEPYGDFYTLEDNVNKVEEILGATAEELRKSNDIYLAVNNNNSKQIRIRTEVTDFSYSVGNISNLSNDKITALIPDLIGLDNVKGQVLSKDGQKFVRVQVRSSDSGGEYILTQYYTVASRQNFVLSFYTNMGEDTEYIEKTFETFSSPSFNSTSEESKRDVISYVILGASVLFLLVCGVVSISIYRDIRKGKTEETD